MNIIEQVKGMRSYEIVRVMVKSLREPWTDGLDMSSYGYVASGVAGELLCFGCAATNTLCELNNRKFPGFAVVDRTSRAQFLRVRLKDLKLFEDAIDALRCGHLSRYNDCMSLLCGDTSTTLIPEHMICDMEEYLPVLYTSYSEEHLVPYEHLADLLENYYKERI